MDDIQKAIKEKVITFVTAALGFVAGLAWNEAIQGLIDKFFKVDGSSLAAQFLYALGVTIIGAVFIVYLNKLGKIDTTKTEGVDQA